MFDDGRPPATSSWRRRLQMVRADEASLARPLPLPGTLADVRPRDTVSR
jgi:hypothetical protein